MAPHTPIGIRSAGTSLAVNSPLALAPPLQGRGRLTIFFSAGDPDTAWQQLINALALGPASVVLHGESGRPFNPNEGPAPSTATAVPIADLLARKPRLVLMPSLVGALDGSGTTRWQRAQALLAAGVSVYAPLDVTELASLGDTIATLTGRRPANSVSDAVLARADDIVWVDRRTAAADEITGRGGDAPVVGAALRKLALRCLTSMEREIDPATGAIGGKDSSYRATVLAVISPDDGEKIVAAAARLAKQLEVSWEVIYLQPPGARHLEAAARETVQQALKLASRLGARTATIPCLNIAETVAQYALNHHAQHVVTGIHPGRSWERWPQRLSELVPALELMLVPVSARQSKRDHFAALFDDELSQPANYVVGALGCVVITLIGLALHPWIENVNVAMLYLLLVFVVARNYGRYPAVLSSVLGSWAFYVYFVPPFNVLGFADVQYFLTFAVLLTVALITGNLTADLRYQTQQAIKRETHTRALYKLARGLSGVLTREDVAATTERIMADSFKVRAGLVYPESDGQLQLSPGAHRIALDLDHARAVYEASDRRRPPPAEPEGPQRYLPLRAPMRTRGVLVLQLDQTHWAAPHGQQSDLETCASLIAIALERIHYVEIAQQALLKIESERLRNSLLTAISHDLRTPLTALVGLTEGLRLATTRDRLRQAIDDICDEAARLSRLVDNLLDMARLQIGAIKLRLEWQSIEEIVGCALYSLRFALAHHRVETRIPAELPLLRCDASLVERVIANLLENAVKYVPAGGRIQISASARQHQIVVAIEDDGPGIPEGAAIFDKFTRGNSESAIPGVGLGLAICHSIVEAHGGELWQQSSPAGGAGFWFSLPLIEPPPAPDQGPDSTAETA